MIKLPWHGPDRTAEYAQRLIALEYLKDPAVVRFREAQRDKIEQLIDVALNLSKMTPEEKIGYVKALRLIAGDIFANEIRELETKISTAKKKGNEKDFYDEVSRIP